MTVAVLASTTATMIRTTHWRRRVKTTRAPERSDKAKATQTRARPRDGRAVRLHLNARCTARWRVWLALPCPPRGQERVATSRRGVWEE